jgi:flagellar hook-associated protein 2
VTGGYEVAVTALASSAQKTYSFASPSSADTVTIDGHQYNLAAGATVQDLANAVNGDSNGTAWAAVTNSNTIVFSDRATGSHTGSYLSVTDSGSALTFQSGADGQNASYSINGGTAQSSSSNTVTSAIPGVTLTLSGITGSTPATVTVGAPAPNATSIQSAVATFVKAYNSIIDQITAQTSQKPVSGDPTQGTLFGDQELGSILSSMRTAMYTPNTSLASGFQSLADIGITTGAGSGSATPSQDSIAGKLTINSTTLAAAIQSNPSNVEKLLQSFGQSFSSLVNAEAAPGGSIDARIQGDTSEISAIGNQIDNMNAALQVKQHALQAQFTAMEVALSNSQSQGSWLSGQLASLSANSIGH